MNKKDWEAGASYKFPDRPQSCHERQQGRPRQGEELKKQRSIRIEDEKRRLLVWEFGSLQAAVDELIRRFFRGL